MRIKRMLLLFLLLSPCWIYAAKSKTFFVSVDASLLQDDGLHVNSYALRVNQQVISASTKEIPYQSHYPAFDTIYYGKGNGRPYSIITRFVPGKHYVITQGCCAMFEFMEKEKYNHLLDLYHKTGDNYNKMDSIRLLNHESPSILVNTKNQAATDSLFVFYGDFSGFPQAFLLSSKKTGPLSSYYGYYSSNVAELMFVRFPKGKIKKQDVKNNMLEDTFPEMENVVCSVALRFFHKEKILATYNEKTKKISLKILK